MVKKILKAFAIVNSDVIAYALALTWAILPFNVESVVWISASKVLLYAFFGHLSFILFIDAYLKPSKSRYILSLIFLLISGLAKEQAVLYPLMMILFVYLHQTKEGHPRDFKKLTITIAPFVGLVFIIGLVTIYVAIFGGGSHHIDRYPFYQRFILSFYCICFYAINCLVPYNLHYHYPFPVKSGLGLPFTYYIYPIVVIFAGWQAYSILKHQKNRNVYYIGLGIFVIHLLLCIQITPLARAAMMADRYMYIPSVGILLISLVFINEKLDLSFKKLSKFHIIALVCFSLYIILLSIYSHTLVDHWKTLQLKT
ncbi:hypothetical protein [Mucilaginibacter sp. UYCu711]|uniref:hypothetical protein n=1 Tax=Mucilaginibacter sp. UYCu711 TaxID=3156339 RepID=UPI003D1F208E